MSTTKAVTDATWEAEVLGADRAVLVDFWAEWCGPCRVVSPIVEELATEARDALKVLKLNVDDNPEVTRRYRVMSIPTLMVFADGVEKKRLVGARGKSQLANEMAEFLPTGS